MNVFENSTFIYPTYLPCVKAYYKEKRFNEILIETFTDDYFHNTLYGVSKLSQQFGRILQMLMRKNRRRHEINGYIMKHCDWCYGRLNEGEKREYFNDKYKTFLLLMISFQEELQKNNLYGLAYYLLGNFGHPEKYYLNKHAAIFDFFNKIVNNIGGTTEVRDNCEALRFVFYHASEGNIMLFCN
jgi:hypothetical protein